MGVKFPVIITLTETGLETARVCASSFDQAEIHGLRGRVAQADKTFDNTGKHIAALFASGHPIIGICASAILIRILAPLLDDKRNEPAVIAVAEDGSAVVPLLGGHNGANRIATKIATRFKVAPAITNAGDVRFGVSLDSPPEGWSLANPQNAKPVMATLLDGEKLHLEGDLDWIKTSDLPQTKTGDVSAVCTIHARGGDDRTLVYHPRKLVLGVGCERGCEASELIALAEKTLEEEKIAPQSIAFVASLDVKSDEPAVHDLAARLGVPARFYSASELNSQASRLANPSAVVMAEVGCPGVAEGAALAGVGPDGVLLVEKKKSKRATCALGQAAMVLQPTKHGSERGLLAIVGIGPGKSDWRTPEVSGFLEGADHWVGYGLYLDLAGPMKKSQKRHQFDLGEEELRVRHALELAGQGKQVALVCSGDAGIYAMAALAFELIDVDVHEDPVSSSARRAEIIVSPGISAFQAASARSGAPFGHDFCLISLSNLLTPWEVIENRIKAAAQGDFVVAFYNPVSKRRRWQLEAARDILLTLRPPETPVILASSLGREKENLEFITLQELTPDRVDMLTLVIIGSSETRKIESGSGRSYVYTPRGYRSKAQENAAQ